MEREQLVMNAMLVANSMADKRGEFVSMFEGGRPGFYFRRELPGEGRRCAADVYLYCEGHAQRVLITHVHGTGPGALDVEFPEGLPIYDDIYRAFQNGATSVQVRPMFELEQMGTPGVPKKEVQVTELGDGTRVSLAPDGTILVAPKRPARFVQFTFAKEKE